MSPNCASRVVPLAALVTAGMLALTGCSNGGTSGGNGQTNYVAGAGGVSTVPEEKRRSPSEIKGVTLQGEKIDVADLKGKVVVMNVWGSWCPPCRAEAPRFVKVAKELKSEGVEFVGINTGNDNQQKAISFEKDYNVEYPSLYDPIGKVILSGFPKGTLNPQAIPSTIVLDRDGRIAARALRALGEEDLRKMIDPLIVEK
ncbi:TlpA family protein disulfide reductase [Streptomyces paludis]|uniref:TlpA family protein disulfide reductase n=1 Tax=Streptomyces paludis TaxID=2282738 RepID=A0A345HQR6_9ACTN|nr:TlpA disulfide reductase family protein [Streptomyces paludis]AXG79040.1 TlpA family protein disulfide reductase [Streptomyces paludis]